ncbi:MAG: hypothetical protein A2271_04135 [Candidatus Moranbacteria bacterium RIFOXYA12_FULL_35_19]|nr:MAG: hypothetical protein UR78_C0014G0017 [Candidatus Moranbacteria bacterium GW2011_GWF2_35_39]OGI32187.1 MAG: hypothetical protein A2489_01300 [Candidatus Moranbacteria bacterium RIFOXYC12_FULL_36_13]OGI36871.1 MAG: hypothetical protein A2271_04135 [Candidatus Moranbacteria bacterium RIFOXYA12_FULL_35_19]
MEGNNINTPPTGEKKSEVDAGIERFQRLIRYIGDDEHTCNKIAYLEEFEKLEKDLISKGYFESEDEIVKTLEGRGVENPEMILKLIRAVASSEKK